MQEEIKILNGLPVARHGQVLKSIGGTFIWADDDRTEEEKRKDFLDAQSSWRKRRRNLLVGRSSWEQE